jgi:hypothetical protein
MNSIAHVTNALYAFTMTVTTAVTAFQRLQTKLMPALINFMVRLQSPEAQV